MSFRPVRIGRCRLATLRPWLVRAAVTWAGIGMVTNASAARPAELDAFLQKHCADCHEGDEKRGGLDLASLAFTLEQPANFATWVKIHDRVEAGEMPPAKRERPAAAESAAFLGALASALTAADKARIAHEGRATQRRLNRYEYENALRDLLSVPGLPLRDMLPVDETQNRFNKSGEALNVSHASLHAYLAAAEHALREAAAAMPMAAPTRLARYYARDERSFTVPMRLGRINGALERATFPVFRLQGQPDVRAGSAPVTVGSKNPAVRELEAVGVLAGPYDEIAPTFEQFRAPVGGRYRLRLNAFSIWVGPTRRGAAWWTPDPDDVSRGRRSEPITLYAEKAGEALRWLGSFDVTPVPEGHEIEVWLGAGETVRPDPARLFRTRARSGRFQNPLAEKDGQPGVAYRWLEVEGPIYDAATAERARLLLGDLPRGAHSGSATITSAETEREAARLMAAFVARASRRPLGDADWRRYLAVVDEAQRQQNSLQDAMLAGYAAVLISPDFLCVAEAPGRLDDHALATRLSLFLGNSIPDVELRSLAEAGRLGDPRTIRAQAERLLQGPSMERFVEAFLDYWLDLRKLNDTAPDLWLYPDYYPDEWLAESARAETLAFFGELIRADLPARNVVASDFAMLNERLARHYGLPAVEGTRVQKVVLPSSSPRGGLLTQASVLKVTANGTTTSPVKRGAWVMERILGRIPLPPPRDIPAIEPDTRGAVTVREQLEKHRTTATCASCHVAFDPLGFALESFDVMGGWRDRYRAITADKSEPGRGRGGMSNIFHFSQPVDPSGRLADGRRFADIRELKQLLLADERQIARALATQLIIFATGTPIGFSDRARVDEILDRAAAKGYGVRSLIHEIIQSELFLAK